MTRRKLEILELQNMETKTFKIHKRKGRYPLFLPLRNFTQCFLKTHKMTRRKIENFETSK
jgi:hypothetical protein